MERREQIIDIDRADIICTTYSTWLRSLLDDGLSLKGQALVHIAQPNEPNSLLTLVSDKVVPSSGQSHDVY